MVILAMLDIIINQRIVVTQFNNKWEIFLVAFGQLSLKIDWVMCDT